MSLPGLRISYLRGWACAPDISAGLRGLLLGKTLVLPAELADAEGEDIADLLALFLDIPIQTIADPSSAAPRSLCVITSPVDEEPDPVPTSVLLCSRRRVAGRKRLEVPHEVIVLRDAVIECVGRRYSGTRIQRVASLMSITCDSPSTALRFASAALAKDFEDPSAPDAELHAAGLAAAIGSLLRGVDVRVAQWVLAIAVTTKRPEKLVGTEAAILGRDAALVAAFEAGLVDMLAEEPTDPLDLRRSLEILGRLEDAIPGVDLALLANALRPHVTREVRIVIERLLAGPPKPLGLGGPSRPPSFVGRADVLQRLTALVEPADMVRTTILHGIDGCGKGTVAAALGELYTAELEPIWVSFLEGPEAGWRRVAIALDIDPTSIDGRRSRERVPEWVKRIHDILRDRACLLVIDDADDVPEDELPAWLPSGPGTCAVLVLSRTSQRALQRAHDAIAVGLKPLRIEDAKQLLETKVPALGEAIERGDLDALLGRLDGHPGAIGLAAGLLESKSAGEVEALLGRRGDSIGDLVRPAIEALDVKATATLQALGVCALAGSPRALPMEIAGAGREEKVIERLMDRSLVVARAGTIRLHGLVRAAVERDLEDAPETRSGLEEAHARVSAAMFGKAQRGEERAAEDELYEDAMLALARMTARREGGDGGVVEVVFELACHLGEYPRGDHGKRINLVIAGFRAALGVWTRATAPEKWADVQVGLGLALSRLPTGDRGANLVEATRAYRAALTVWTKDGSPEDWANVQNNLGTVLSELSTGSREEHVRAAIDAFRAALTVRTSEAFPSEWAATQNNLANALAQLPAGDHLNEAIDAYRAALSVYTKEAFPHDWAVAESNLGIALAWLPTGDKAENLRTAIEAYRAALTLQTRATFPVEWAHTLSNLGFALSALPSGTPTVNIREAVDAFRASLTVFTKDAFPHNWGTTQQALDAALHKLADLEASRPRT